MGFFRFLSSGSNITEKHLDKLRQELQAQIDEHSEVLQSHSEKIYNLEQYHVPDNPDNDIQYPTQVPHTEMYGNYEKDTEVKPYLQWQNGEFENTKYCRIGDRETFNATNNRIRHNYSLVQPFNADGSLLLFSSSPVCAVLDGNTYEYIKTIGVNSTARWSHLDPDVIYQTEQNKFIKYNYSTNSKTTLRTFNYSNVEITSKGNTDNFDKIVALKAGNTVIVYNIQTDTIVSERNFSNVKWVMTSQLGTRIVVGYNSDGSGASQGIKSYNLNLQDEKHLVSSTPHGDCGIDVNGNEVFVGMGTSEQFQQKYSLFMVNLSTGVTTNLFKYYGDDDGLWWGHLSCRNIDREGYAYISHDTVSGTYPMANDELFAIKLDDSGLVERYGKSNNNPSNYYHQTQLVPNRNGKKIIYASNSNNASEKGQFAAPSYVLELI